MLEELIAQHYVYTVGSMREYIVLGKSEDKLVYVHYRYAYGKYVQGGYAPVYKHLVNNYLSHYRRQYAQYLHCEYRYEYLYELLLEFKYRRNEPLEAEDRFPVHYSFFIDYYRCAVPHSLQVYPCFYFRLRLVR